MKKNYNNYKYQQRFDKKEERYERYQPIILDGWWSNTIQTEEDIIKAKNEERIKKLNSL